MLKNFCIVDVFFLLQVVTGRGELTERSKLTCFAKRLLDNRSGGSGEWHRRLASAAVRHGRRTCQVKKELGKGKIGALRCI